MFFFNNNIGRLGNQLFLYAAARSLCKKRKVAYVFSGLDKLKYFRLTKQDHWFNDLKKTWFKYRVRRYGLHRQLNIIDCWTDHYKTVLSASEHQVVTGYFQGEWYFRENEAEIRELFQVRPQYRKRLNEIYQQQMKGHSTVAIHIRRTDYINHNWVGLGGPGFALPLSYYKGLIEKYSNSNRKFIFVSDDIGWVKEQFSYLDNAWFSGEDEITDLQILMHADICILSNSSFSWWGGWLNDRPNKVIYMPKYYCGFKVKKEFPVGIIPRDFKQVEVATQTAQQD